MLPLLALLALGQTEGRIVTDLNDGWEFVRVPQPPSIWTGPDALSTALWKVVSVSSEETTSEKAEAKNAFDNNPQTFWHSEWKDRQPGYPHELVIDLGSTSDIVGIRILNRQTGPQNGRPNHFQVFLSSTATDWTKPTLDANMPDSAALFERKFDLTKARYLKLVFLDAHRKDEPYIAISEIGLIKNLDLTKNAGWETQYTNTMVQLGDRRFDLRGDDLEKLKATEMAALKDEKWQSALLPHAAWLRPLNTAEIWQGVAYYRKDLDLPKEALSKHLELEIDGALHASDLWLNGEHIAERRGGYMPMIVNLTGKLKAKNELLIRVDNSDNPLIPPGKPQSQVDFMYGNGLTRGAKLTITNDLYITNPLTEDQRYGGGIYVVYPQVSVKQATIRIHTHIRNEGVAKIFNLEQELRDSKGKAVAKIKTTQNLEKNANKRFQQELILPKPKLWSPENPNRYTLKTTLTQNGHIIDQQETKIGIRTISVSRKNGMLINGKPIRLVGTNRHQDYPWVGSALSDNANRRDAVLIKRSGHHIIRLSHYPQSPAFLDACDELGILTIPCIAGWQFMNNDIRFNERVYRDIRELIRRDRNHPSVAFWEASLNETYPPVEIAKQWYKIAKEEFIEGGDQPVAGDATTGAPWDVVYNGWQSDLSRPQDAAPDKPGYIREYYDYEFGGAYSTTRVPLGQSIDKLLQAVWNAVWSNNRFRTQYPWTMGCGTWEMFDHNVPYEYGVSASGVADLFRREKPVFWFYKSQEEKKPYLKAVADWQPGKPKRTVVVFTNCDEATLSINGKNLITARAEKGKSTSYDKAKPFDGTNTENLQHPPIVFHDVPYSQGILKIEGKQNGKVVTQDVIQTALDPVKIKIEIDDLGIPPGLNDMVFIRATLLDRNNVICVGESQKIMLATIGANILGESSVPCQAGVATVLMRLNDMPRLVQINATTSKGLKGTLKWQPKS